MTRTYPTLEITTTPLRWKRVYDTPPKRYGPRPAMRTLCETDDGIYELHFKRNKYLRYTVSFTPTGGERIDLGQYVSRLECDLRLATHRQTGR